MERHENVGRQAFKAFRCLFKKTNKMKMLSDITLTSVSTNASYQISDNTYA